MNSGLYSVLYLMYFIILDSVLYFADIECGFSHDLVAPDGINLSLLDIQCKLNSRVTCSLISDPCIIMNYIPVPVV